MVGVSPSPWLCKGPGAETGDTSRILLCPGSSSRNAGSMPSSSGCCHCWRGMRLLSQGSAPWVKPSRFGVPLLQTWIPPVCRRGMRLAHRFGVGLQTSHFWGLSFSGRRTIVKACLGNCLARLKLQVRSWESRLPVWSSFICPTHPSCHEASDEELGIQVAHSVFLHLLYPSILP